jgi:hypothetical protein
MCSAIVNGLTRFMAFTFFHRTHLVFLGVHWVGAVWVLFGYWVCHARFTLMSLACQIDDSLTLKDQCKRSVLMRGPSHELVTLNF